MIDKGTVAHLGRLEQALFNTYDLHDVVRYLEEHTYIKGDRFSFKDHEFQKDIASDTSKLVYVQKCAQVGLSELMARYALAVAKIMPYFSVILTMPFSKDAVKFAKSRINPIIDESSDLREAIDPDLDNTEIKGIDGSLLYMRGCNGTTAAISVPADMLIHDEVDRSDPDTLGQYQSRLKHSPWKLTRKFGTPTMDGVGIALDMTTARRMRHATTCHLCNHLFVPNFHEHVKIPDYAGRFQEINKNNLHTLRWKEARLHCPSCDGEPSLQPKHRSWVCENPGDDFEAVGYFVTPFSVPNIVSIPSLVREITVYKSWAEFVNQALGETANDQQTQLSPKDLNETLHNSSDLSSNETHNMGIDVGQICHILVGRLDLQGKLLVIHKERCLLAELKAKKLELQRKYRVLMTVIDSQPETWLVQMLQRWDKNLFGAVYRENRKLAVYEAIMVDKDLKKGKLPINQAAICRDVNFDEVMALFKERQLLWQTTDRTEDELFKAHCLDMRRQQDFDRSKEMIYRWVKSREGQDHYMHTLGYLHVACRLAPTASKNMSFGRFPIVATLKMTERKPGVALR